jgi:hypothetical protein
MCAPACETAEEQTQCAVRRYQAVATRVRTFRVSDLFRGIKASMLVCLAIQVYADAADMLIQDAKLQLLQSFHQAA